MLSAHVLMFLRILLCSCASVSQHLMLFRVLCLYELFFSKVAWFQILCMCAIGSQFARSFLALTTAMEAPFAMGPDYQRKNVYKLFIKGVHADMEGHGLEAIVQTMGYQPTKGFVSRG